MPQRRSTADKLKKPLQYLLVFLVLCGGTLYYYVKGESEAPGFDDWADDYAVRGMEVHFLDVGQGDCTLLLCGDSAVLIDGGEYENGRDIVSYLKHHGVEKIDLLVATHRHSDHIGGLIVVLQKMQIDEVLVNRSSVSNNTDAQSEMEFVRVLKERGTAVTYAEADKTYKFDGMHLSVLFEDPDSTDENEHSVILYGKYEDFSVLLTGDIGQTAEEELLDREGLDCDIFKAAHHGSKYSNTQEFLKTITPAITVISCGEENLYGHPHDETIERFLSVGADVYRTDIMGTVAFSCDDNTIEVLTNGKDQ